MIYGIREDPPLPLSLLILLSRVLRLARVSSLLYKNFKLSCFSRLTFSFQLLLSETEQIRYTMVQLFRHLNLSNAAQLVFFF